MESSLRLRLVFQDPEILGESQRAEGLTQALISVNESLEIISKLSDHLSNVFQLRDSCPNGLVLTMGGFVLPPFESISILSTRDIVSVKRKYGDTITARLEDERNCGEFERYKAEQSVNAGMKLLQDKEFEKESGIDFEEAEPEKLEVIEASPKSTHKKKRKALKKLNESSGGTKRKRCESTKEALGSPEDLQKEIEPEQNVCSNQHVLLSNKCQDSSDTSVRVENSSDSDINEKEKNVNACTTEEKRSGQIHENKKSNGAANTMCDGIELNQVDLEKMNREKKSLASKPVGEDAGNVKTRMEFEKLTLYTALPQVGDIVAYRVIEVSSSWCREMSSFRVGKILKFDPGSNSITLVQVPEYPIEFEKDEDEAEESTTKSNMYRDDGSHQMKYSSLIDVRMVKNLSRFVISRVSAADEGASLPDSKNQPKLKKRNSYEQSKPSTTTAHENEKVNALDEVWDMLSAKKAELTKKKIGLKKRKHPRARATVQFLLRLGKER